MVQPSRTHNQSSILLTDAELDDINRWTHWGSCLWWEAVEKILRRCTIYLRALFFPATTWVCARLLWALRLPTSLTAFHRTGSVTNGSYMKISTQGLETAFKMLPPPPLHTCPGGCICWNTGPASINLVSAHPDFWLPEHRLKGVVSEGFRSWPQNIMLTPAKPF